jgi:hypothetical protein
VKDNPGIANNKGIADKAGMNNHDNKANKKPSLIWISWPLDKRIVITHVSNPTTMVRINDSRKAKLTPSW